MKTQQQARAYQTLTDADFHNETRGGIIVALFYSSLRGHDPETFLHGPSQLRYDDDVRFVALDADSSPETPRRFGAVALPAILCLRNGIIKALIQHVGDSEDVAEAARGNACYRCANTAARTRRRREQTWNKHH